MSGTHRAISCPSLITLTTDFGSSSPYVAIIKGVILSINPAVTLVDISHEIEHQNVRQGALVLEEATRWFPPDTIHLAVVDPGVGSQRRIVYARIGQHHHVGPDNGLLGRLALASAPSTIINVTERRYWLPQVSATFQGRDIMAPVAAHLSLGVAPQRFGEPLEQLVQLPWAEVRVTKSTIAGRVQAIDSFGNLVTDITAQMLESTPTSEQVTITCDEHETCGIFRTYSDQPEMTLIALIGSSGHLELAIVGDSAAAMLGAKVGAPVTVKW